MHIQTRSAQIVVECRTLIDSSSQGTPCKTQSGIRPRQLGRGCNCGYVRVSLVDDNPNREIGTGWGKVDRLRARRRVGRRESVPIRLRPADGLKRKLMEQSAPWARLEPQAGQAKVTLMVRCATGEGLAPVFCQAKVPPPKKPGMFAR